MAPDPAGAAGAWAGNWTVIGDNGDNIFWPRGMAVDGNDNVYVVDNYFYFIHKLPAGSTTWSNLKGISFTPGQDWLQGVAADGANNIYVLNSIQNTSRVVWKYNGTSWTDITYGYQFRQPEAIAADSNGNVYVNDSFDGYGHVLKLAAGSTSWSEIGNWDNGQFVNVTAITADSQNNLYVTDYSGSDPNYFGIIKKLASGTTTWQPFTGVSGFRLQMPLGIARDNFGNLYVADKNRNELHTVPDGSTSWAYIGNGDPNTFSDPYGVAVDSKGYVYVTDPTNGKVYKHAPWATQLIWQTQPGGALAGSPLNPQPVAALAGATGDVVISGSSGYVSVALTNPGGAALNGSTSVALSSGAASFSNLSVSNTGTYTLTATGTIDNTDIWDIDHISGIGTTTVTGQSNNFTITAPPTAATPTASPPSGSTVANNSTVTLSTATAGATIYYTTDGSNPTTSSPSGTSVVITSAPGATVTVKAIAGGPGFTTSPVATFTYTLQPQVATPTASPVSGTTVANNTTVTLATTTAGATIYYTTNGSDPTTSSASGTEVVITGVPEATVTVKAMAAAPNMANSAIASFTYYLQPQAAAPTASPPGGSVVVDNSIVTLSTTTAGATIYYTTDESDPSISSTSGSSVAITGASGATVTVKALAIAAGYADSNISTFTYTIGSAVAAPTASPVSGSTVANNSTVTLSTTSAGATIYYTTDGSDPTIGSASGTSVVITGTPETSVTVKAMAIAPGMANSGVAAFIYHLQSQTAAPTASPPDGSLVIDNTTVTLEHPSPNAVIYYTTDGSAPTTSSPSGTSVIITGSVGATITVQALAVAPGMENSNIAAFSYTIAQHVEAPTASPASGTTVANGITVTLSTTTAGATIYYTTDGSEPTSGSASGNSVTISGIPESMVTVKAFATAPGMVDSSIETYTYTLQPLTETPTAIPPSGSVVVNNTTVTLLTSLPNAAIYYTLDGSDPTTSSDSGSSVIISGAPGDTVTLKAFAVAPERENSDIATFTYTIGLPAEPPTASLPSGTTVANNTVVDLSSTSPNATIYYTLDGSVPTQNSLSGSSATISGAPAATVTLKAMAMAPGMADSDIATFTYYLQPQAASPTAIPASGSTVENHTTVTLTTTTVGATIYYTTDGSTPTTSNTSGTSVVITGASGLTVTIKAFAAAPSTVDSDVAVFTYRIRSSSSGGSSSGSGSSSGTRPTGILVTPPGGSFGEQGVTLTFPAGAVEDDIRVQIREVSRLAGNLPDNSQLLSRILDITKDKSGHFSQPVTITLTFNNSGIDPDEYDIAIYYYDEDRGKWIALDNIKLNFKTGTISGNTNHFTKFAVIASPKVVQEEKPVKPEPPQPTINVPRDISDHWAQDSIRKTINAGVVSGYPDGTFQPDKAVTRAEFTVMLVKALQLEVKAGKSFTDTTSHWAKDSLSTAAAHRIISGYDENTFGPDNLITREQAAVIIARAAQLAEVTGWLDFTDSQAISAWAKPRVAAAVKADFISGYPDGSFKPQGNTTRAEAAVIISKLLR